MEKKNESILDRKLRDSDFKDVAVAIKGGKESKSLKHAELVENLVSQLKGRDVHAVVEVFSTVLLLSDAKELVAVAKCHKSILYRKMTRELAKKAKKGEITTHDVIIATMLKEILERE